MKRTNSLGGVLAAMTAVGALAQAPAEVTLTRLDCGTSAPAPTDVARFSDTYAYTDLKLQIVFSCYLIKHGSEYMVWDAGNAVSTAANSPKTPLPDLLKQLKVNPDEVKYLGISHYHG